MSLRLAEVMNAEDDNCSNDKYDDSDNEKHGKPWWTGTAQRIWFHHTHAFRHNLKHGTQPVIPLPSLSP